MQVEQIHRFSSVNAAFSKQAVHYDVDDKANPILQSWRERVYAHLGQFLKTNSMILELNAGSGIDATYFVKSGHKVHATDVSEGMIEQIQQKIDHDHELQGNLSCKLCSYTDIGSIGLSNIDYVFSNFGGLNCIDDLSKVTKELKRLLKPNAYITFVIMPKITPWEWLWVLKGQFKMAFRRLSNKGTLAHLEGEYFKTYYFSLTEIKKAFGKDFQLKRCDALGVVSPPPGSSRFYHRFTRLTKFLEGCDKLLSMMWPFNRWGDHIIATFQYKGKKHDQSTT